MADPVYPLDQRFDAAKITGPDRLSLPVMTTEKLILRTVIHRFWRRLDPDQIRLVAADPGQIRVWLCRPVADEIRLTIRRMFQVPAEIDKMRRTDLDLTAVFACFAKN